MYVARDIAYNKKRGTFNSQVNVASMKRVLRLYQGLDTINADERLFFYC